MDPVKEIYGRDDKNPQHVLLHIIATQLMLAPCFQGLTSTNADDDNQDQEEMNYMSYEKYNTPSSLN